MICFSYQYIVPFQTHIAIYLHIRFIVTALIKLFFNFVAGGDIGDAQHTAYVPVRKKKMPSNNVQKCKKNIISIINVVCDIFCFKTCKPLIDCKEIHIWAFS